MGAHRGRQGSAQKSTREHTEVDKGAHRGRQGSIEVEHAETDRQTREHAEAYERRQRGSQGMTQRQIRGQSVADKGRHSPVAIHNSNSSASKSRAFNTRRSGGRRGSRGLNI